MRASKRGRGVAFARAAALSLAACIGFLGTATPARAEPHTKACVDAYDAEQRRMEAGDLLGAREQLYVCGATSCPAVVVKQCVEALADVEARLPTIALAVQDAAGHDLTDVKVTLDGAPFRDRVDGREVPLNPGPHVLRFVAGGDRGSSTEVRIVAREREKGRLVRAVLPAASDVEPMASGGTTTREPSAPAAVPTLTWVFGGLGVVALGAFTYFGVTGLSARSDLDGCAPNCATRQRDDARAMLRDADIALGVAVVSFGVAATVYLLRPRAAASSSSSSSMRSHAALFTW